MAETPPPDRADDERYWRAYRVRVRTRASAQMALIVAPIMMAVAFVAFVAPMDHPAGDVRDTIPFRLASSGFLIGIALTLIITAVRWLRADRRRTD